MTITLSPSPKSNKKSLPINQKSIMNGKDREDKKSGCGPVGKRNLHHKKMICKAMLLDDSVVPFQVLHKSVGKNLLDEVTQSLNLLETDYFGLEYADQESNKCWVDNEKLIINQVDMSHDVIFKFCVKFYAPDPTQLEEEYTRYLYCLQLKRDLSDGTMPCSDSTSALLASYIVQADCGDYSFEDYPDHTYLSGIKFFPQQTPQLEKMIMENHKKHAGQTPAEADLNFLDIARRVEMYGIRLHPAQDHEGVGLNLAVAHTGILVYQNNIRINTFSWVKIRKLSFKRKKFLIKLHPEEYGYYKDTVEFYFNTRNQSKNFWKKCIEYHTFFRVANNFPVSNEKLTIRHKRTKLFSKGSSFRYSGRTQKEVIAFVRESVINRQPFTSVISPSIMAHTIISQARPQISVSSQLESDKKYNIPALLSDTAPFGSVEAQLSKTSSTSGSRMLDTSADDISPTPLTNTLNFNNSSQSSRLVTSQVLSQDLTVASLQNKFMMKDSNKATSLQYVANGFKMDENYHVYRPKSRSLTTNQHGELVFLPSQVSTTIYENLSHNQYSNLYGPNMEKIAKLEDDEPYDYEIEMLKYPEMAEDLSYTRKSMSKSHKLYEEQASRPINQRVTQAELLNQFMPHLKNIEDYKQYSHPQFTYSSSGSSSRIHSHPAPSIKYDPTTFLEVYNHPANRRLPQPHSTVERLITFKDGKTKSQSHQAPYYYLRDSNESKEESAPEDYKKRYLPDHTVKQLSRFNTIDQPYPYTQPYKSFNSYIAKDEKVEIKTPNVMVTKIVEKDHSNRRYERDRRYEYNNVSYDFGDINGFPFSTLLSEGLKVDTKTPILIYPSPTRIRKMEKKKSEKKSQLMDDKNKDRKTYIKFMSSKDNGIPFSFTSSSSDSNLSKSSELSISSPLSPPVYPTQIQKTSSSFHSISKPSGMMRGLNNVMIQEQQRKLLQDDIPYVLHVRHRFKQPHHSINTINDLLKLGAFDNKTKMDRSKSMIQAHKFFNNYPTRQNCSRQSSSESFGCYDIMAQENFGDYNYITKECSSQISNGDIWQHPLYSKDIIYARYNEYQNDNDMSLKGFYANKVDGDGRKNKSSSIPNLPYRMSLVSPVKNSHLRSNNTPSPILKTKFTPNTNIVTINNRKVGASLSLSELHSSKMTIPLPLQHMRRRHGTETEINLLPHFAFDLVRLNRLPAKTSFSSLDHTGGSINDPTLPPPPKTLFTRHFTYEEDKDSDEEEQSQEAAILAALARSETNVAAGATCGAHNQRQILRRSVSNPAPRFVYIDDCHIDNNYFEGRELNCSVVKSEDINNDGKKKKKKKVVRKRRQSRSGSQSHRGILREPRYGAINDLRRHSPTLPPSLSSSSSSSSTPPPQAAASISRELKRNSKVSPGPNNYSSLKDNTSVTEGDGYSDITIV
ncbi:uncharacterized protein LOC135922894 isoform X2 [Gordionus sp. m RMFG-2023]|uniref:uncharacterized protein LOC135922894 isoform X2 n=1 Tax=Gordionus sp. m RMFG-2023 TaxID=3053472 RepID=UPI0031FBC545